MTETMLDDSVNDTLPPPDPEGNAAYTAQFRHYSSVEWFWQSVWWHRSS